MVLGRLHLITDSPSVAGAALAVGTPVVQVRLPITVADREAYEVTARILALCRAAGATCLVNDRLDVALAVGADGAHVGASDLPVAVARRLLGPAAILGATARDPAAARAAVAGGASYLGVGPAFATSTKDGLPDPIGPEGVAAVVSAVPGTPVIAIGGITADRAPTLLAAGAHGVAVVGAINAAPDPGAAAASLLGVIMKLAARHADASSANFMITRESRESREGREGRESRAGRQS